MTQDLAQNDHFVPKTSKGAFVRIDSVFRHQVTPHGDEGFKAEQNRYHLYISHACPWANRTMIFRSLKQLESLITVDVVHPLMGPESWHFGSYPGSTKDTINQKTTMRDVYQMADPDYSGVVTVPVLWDKKNGTIVNNESSEIIRMFNSAFNDLTGNHDDYYPEHLQDEIDSLNQRIYDTVNNGVYRCGFATTQGAYEEAVTALFDTLDFLEERLEGREFLVGDQATEADWRLFVTLIRFDPVYVGHFKCNLRRLIDYPNLWRYTRRLYNSKGIADTVNLEQIKYHYYASHKSLNPTGIVPKGPVLDYSLPG